ncbi:hypothetical protein CMUS01_04825 [Colletotrichum musicola]|uniref:Uncharacterized protein n=1 Tax=Colletotrichum musicola TaxID=2175873 RepID=A0A8H6NLP1_9PEZI|nr:hypothetical protein CMUS01_04825 [Colletotrichum musicola]
MLREERQTHDWANLLVLTQRVALNSGRGGSTKGETRAPLQTEGSASQDVRLHLRLYIMADMYHITGLKWFARGMFLRANAEFREDIDLLIVDHASKPWVLKRIKSLVQGNPDFGK